MTGTTHFAAGVLAAAALQPFSLPALVGVAVGVMLPDIDSKTSVAGKLVPIIPDLIKHRTWTHTVWLALLLGAVWPPLGLGCLLHVVMDSITVEGIAPLWPCPIKICLPIAVRTGGILDRFLGICCWLGTAWIAAIKLGVWSPR